MSDRMTGMIVEVSWIFLPGRVTPSMLPSGTVCTQPAVVASGRKYTPSSTERFCRARGRPPTWSTPPGPGSLPSYRASLR
ncbi:hypothetical protein GBAR_LOCUS9782, partial [Geodia barretti]